MGRPTDFAGVAGLVLMGIIALAFTLGWFVLSLFFDMTIVARLIPVVLGLSIAGLAAYRLYQASQDKDY